MKTFSATLPQVESPTLRFLNKSSGKALECNFFLFLWPNIMFKNRHMHSPEDPDFFLNKTNNDGQTALFIAAKNGNVKVVELLLRFNASPETLSKPSKSSQKLFSPLYAAAM